MGGLNDFVAITARHIRVVLVRVDVEQVGF